MISIPAIVFMPVCSCLWMRCVTTATTGREFVLACRWCKSMGCCMRCRLFGFRQHHILLTLSLVLSFSRESSLLIYFGVLMCSLISASIHAAFSGDASLRSFISANCAALILLHRPAASSTSSAYFPGSHAAFTTSVNCAAPGCGTAATSPPWSVRVNIQTLRAAPMEAPPPPSRPHPHPPRHPHPRQTSPRHLHRMVREALRPETFSPSGSRPEVEAVGSSLLVIVMQMSGSTCWICVPTLSPSSLLLVLHSFKKDVLPIVEQCRTLPYQNVVFQLLFHMTP